MEELIIKLSRIYKWDDNQLKLIVTDFKMKVTKNIFKKIIIENKISQLHKIRFLGGINFLIIIKNLLRMKVRFFLKKRINNRIIHKENET
jgi:hypothetical protein